MNIALISTNANIESGASKSLVILSSLLKERYNANILVILPQHGNLEKYLLEKNIFYKVVRHSNTVWFKHLGSNGKSPKNSIRILINFVAKIRLHFLLKDYDIVHINALTSGVVAEVCEKDNKKLVWHFREFMEEDLGIEFMNYSKALKLIDSATCRIAISNSVAEKYRKILKNEINVIYNGIDSSEYYIARTEMILENDKIKILMPGRISEFKGQFTLVKALRYLKEKEGISVSATIVGNGAYDYLNKLKEYVSLNALDVCFVEYTKELYQYYLEADVVCVCSKQEAFGRVTVEGMMAGNLVIGADSGGTKELIENGQTGLLYECDNYIKLADTIKFIIKNRDAMREIAYRGQVYALRNFSAEKNAEEIYKIYEKVLSIFV